MIYTSIFYIVTSHKMDLIKWIYTFTTVPLSYYKIEFLNVKKTTAKGLKLFQQPCSLLFILSSLPGVSGGRGNLP